MKGAIRLLLPLPLATIALVMICCGGLLILLGVADPEDDTSPLCLGGDSYVNDRYRGPMNCDDEEKAEMPRRLRRFRSIGGALVVVGVVVGLGAIVMLFPRKRADADVEDPMSHKSENHDGSSNEATDAFFEAQDD